MYFSIAHIREDKNGNVLEQTATEHSINTANYASKWLSHICLDQLAYLTGLLHDLGKYKKEFQEYLRGNGGSKGSVIHTFAGARYILESYRKNHIKDGGEIDEFDIMAELVGYAVAAHHGLFDISESGKEIGFSYRITKKDIGYEECVANFFRETVDKETIAIVAEDAASQISAVIDKITSLPDEGTDYFDEEIAFYIGLLERLLLSALIDGDHTDTAAFMKGVKFHFPIECPDWNKYLIRTEERLEQFLHKDAIDIARKKISDQCKFYAEKPGGILRLNVPTGGGKTLASLRYALAHARNFKKSRIIFTAPLLTILEQNSEVIRSFIQDDDMILEHHSNIIKDRDNQEDERRYELLTQNWSAPIILTSMVQLLNTMFDGKTSSIRRFHSLVNSIIVIDEVQTIPLKLLSLFNLTVNFLTKICGAAVVLCSATQPCLEQIEHPIVGNVEDIVPFEVDLWKAFKRTNIIDAGRMKLLDVPNFAREVLEKTQSLLVICNKKSEAEMIYDSMRTEDAVVFHLSASMCGEHRKKVLKDLYNSLHKKQKKTICVSTQVIEAGVDISFGTVIRLAAGMDSIVQAAGRCNRNSELNKVAPVYILQIEDEDLSRLGDIKKCKDATIALLEQIKFSPDNFERSLTSDGSIQFYYHTLFSKLSKGETDFPTKKGTLFNLLGSNYCNDDLDSTFYMNQAFKSAGSLFSVFDDNSIDLIVPYGEGKDIICELTSIRSDYEYDRMNQLLEKAKKYSVSVHSYQQKKYEEEGAIHWICDGRIAILEENYYHPEKGITFEEQLMEFQEV